MVEESFLGRVVTVMMEITSLIYEKDMVRCIGMMDLCTKAIGTKESNQDLVACGYLIIRSERAYSRIIGIWVQFTKILKVRSRSRVKILIM